MHPALAPARQLSGALAFLVSAPSVVRHSFVLTAVVRTSAQTSSTSPVAEPSF